jgi:hypothetical protein
LSSWPDLWPSSIGLSSADLSSILVAGDVTADVNVDDGVGELTGEVVDETATVGFD